MAGVHVCQTLDVMVQQGKALLRKCLPDLGVEGGFVAKSTEGGMFFECDAAGREQARRRYFVPQKSGVVSPLSRM
jgi:hypothetical protein